MVPYLIGDDSITMLGQDGKSHSVDSSHANYSLLKDAIRAQDWDRAQSLLDVKTALTTYAGGDVEVRDGNVFYLDRPVDNVVTDRILDMMYDGFDYAPMANFLAKLMENPSKSAVDELYLFLEANGLTIFEDGDFAAYKGVRSDLMDVHSATVDYSPGQRPSMPRNEVDDRREVTCSKGLHFGAYEFASGWGQVLLLVKINPRDVVSIPNDYNNQKGRCCELESVAVVEGEVDSPVYVIDADAA